MTDACMSPGARAVRRERADRGLSQSELALRTGIPRARVSLIENGHVKRLFADEAIALERELGIPVSTWEATDPEPAPLAAAGGGR